MSGLCIGEYYVRTMNGTGNSGEKRRDILADVLRGFAIVLVVVGHCIQENNGAVFSSEMLYFDDKVYQFIYSFHMPLFALIAGYYAYYSVKKADDKTKRYRLLIKRVTTYLIPIAVWTAEEYIRGMIINARYGIESEKGFGLITAYLYRVLNNHWFLWAMIFCFVIVWVMHFYLADNVILYACMFILFFFIPDGMNMHTYKFLLPFYLIAFYYNLSCNDSGMNHTADTKGCAVIKADRICRKISGVCRKWYEERLILLTVISAVVFAILFAVYRRRAFIYVSGYRITKDVWYIQLITDVYRFAVGLAGCIFFICLWRVVLSGVKGYAFPLLRAFGRYSLGVYLISGYTTILLVRRFTDALEPNDLRACLIAIPVALISLLGTFILSKVPLIRKAVGQ